MKYLPLARKVLSEFAPANDEIVSKFAGCLEVCFDWYNDARSVSTPVQPFDKKYSGDLKRAIEMLIPLLEDPQAHPIESFAATECSLTTVAATLRSIQRIISLQVDSTPSTGLEADLLQNIRYEGHFKQRSPFEWIAGIYLPELFYLFIDSNATRGKGRKFLQFAQTVLEGLKIRPGPRKKFSSESISKAVRLVPLTLLGPVSRRKNGPLYDADINDPYEWRRHMAFAFACGFRSKTPIELMAQEMRRPAKAGRK